jgi:putative CocE/NonD family hydrolase
LQADGKLGWDPPAQDELLDYDEYISDPLKPVPYTNEIATKMIREYMVEDQRFASKRPDVLTYETDPLDKPVTLAGPVLPNLNVSTTGTDSDFVVKLIDVYPDDAPDPQDNPDSIRMGGFQQLVRGELFRGRFRNSFSDPEPFIPGQIANVHYKMPDVFHEFQKGHRIMIQIQSSWFPLVDINPQQFVDIYNAKKEDFKKATQRVYRSKDAPSSIVVYELK